MILDNPNKRIEIVLGSAKTTTDMPVCVSFEDRPLGIAGSFDTQTNGTTAVPFLTGAPLNTTRVMKELTVFNVDTVAKLVTIRLSSAGTLRPIYSCTLQVGDMLGYTDYKGWYVKDSSGNEKTSAAQYATIDPTALWTPFRNRIINSDMSVSQVNGGTAVTNTTAVIYVPDQFYIYGSVASKFTAQQVADAPAGLKYSTKLTVASQYAAGAAEAFIFAQNIEGQNIIDFQLGTAGAATIVTSQWIKGSVAGTYSVSIRNSASNRSYVGTVNVTTSWQRLSIYLVGDVTGTWATDTSAGMSVTFDLGSGSNFVTTAGSWQAGNFTHTSGSVAFVNQVAGSTLNITGVQVEAVPTGATTPTAFEFLPYETQLRRAQRYLPPIPATIGLGIAYGTNILYGGGLVALPVTARVAPTGVLGGAFSVSGGSAGTVGLRYASVQNVSLFNSANNWTAGSDVSLTTAAFLTGAQL